MSSISPLIDKTKLTLILACVIVAMNGSDSEKKHEYDKPRRDRIAAEELWSDAATHPATYRNLCRFTRDEVMILAESLNIKIGDEEGIDLSKHKHAFTPLRQLEYFLHTLSVASSFRTLSSFFCWHRTSISKNFYHHIDLILEKLDSPAQPWAIRWLTNDEFNQFRQNQDYPLMTNCFGAVDATYIFIPEPKDPALQPIFQSSYKNHRTCVFFIVVCDRRGRIIYCDSGNAPAIATNREGLAFSRCREYFPPDLKVLGDKAYTHDSRCITPF